MKAKITMKNKMVVEYENDVATANLLREIEGCKAKNTFFSYKNFYLNPLEIEVIEVLEDQKMKSTYTPIVAEEKSLEEKQLEKQPLLNQYKNVVK